MPLSTSSCRGRCDANVATEANQGAAGAQPACEVRGADILNACELAEGGPFVLAFVFEPVARCREQHPGAERVAARHRDVTFRIVAVRADAAARARCARTCRSAIDNDGAVANEYAVVVCPTITYVRRGREDRRARRSARSTRTRSRSGWRGLRAEPPIVVGPPDRALIDVRLVWCGFAVERNPMRRSSPALRRRLHALSDRHGGARAITQATREIPEAYRILSRRLGDGERRSPVEELTIKRLIRGQYRSRGVLRDALLIATVDTEVGVWALDADLLQGEPRALDRAVVDDTGPIVGLLESPDTVTRATRRLVLYALLAPGVPDMAIEEALLTAWEIIATS